MRHIYVGNLVPGGLQGAHFRSYTDSVTETVKAASRHFGPPDRRVLTDYAQGRVTESAEDILLGVVTVDPARTGRMSDWMAANRLAAGARTHPNCYLLFQSTPDPTFPEQQHALMPHFERQLLDARLIFATLGVHWYRQWQARDDLSVAAKVKHKVVRVNVGCDVEHLQFREPVKRERSAILHVSNLQWYKNPALLLASVKGIDATVYLHSNHPLARRGMTIAGDDGRPLPNVVPLGLFSNADPAFTRWVHDHADFWISTSRRDAQSTCLLEMAARGLVPIVTPGVGFESPYAVMLTEDAARNRHIIADALAMPQAEYSERSIGVRRQVERYHRWEDVYRRINAAIADDQRGLRAAPDPGEALS